LPLGENAGVSETGLIYDPRCLLHNNGSMVVDERVGR
jgi:hypothetical protein